MAAPLWLAGGKMGPEDPSDLLVTINAEDVFDVSRELHRIGAPTLVIAGERDRFYGPELSRETADRIPDARLRLYPGKGHARVLTYPPAVREILRFLTADAVSV
jgi:pimeloyl-ACP methyl ester carboxylesterase